jgi:hypothetical protein
MLVCISSNQLILEKSPMSEVLGTANASSTSVWIGRVISALATLALLADAAVSLFAPHMLSAEMAATGFPPGLATTLGIITAFCVVLYAIPQTAMLGAILVTGFLGGAICTHFRLGEMLSPPQLICLLLGVMTWGGLYLRDPRLRALLPFTST